MRKESNGRREIQFLTSVRTIMQTGEFTDMQLCRTRPLHLRRDDMQAAWKISFEDQHATSQENLDKTFQCCG